jgi:hypothetical protein
MGSIMISFSHKKYLNYVKKTTMHTTKIAFFILSQMCFKMCPKIFRTQFFFYSSNLKVQVSVSYHGHSYYIITQNIYLLTLAMADTVF